MFSVFFGQIRTIGNNFRFTERRVHRARTEYELLDYTGTMMGNFQSALAFYFTIVTAYVIAADRLTRLQLYVVNTCFVIAASVVGYLTVAI